MKQLSFNLIALAVARVGWRGFAAITAILAARHLGVDQFGTFASALAFCSIAATFTDPGAGVVVLRAAARNQDDLSTVLGNAVALTGALAIAVYGSMLVVADFVGCSPLLWSTIAVLGAGMVIEGIHLPFVLFFQGLERMHITGAFQVLPPALTAALALAIVSTDGDVVAFSSSRLFAALLVLPFLANLAWRTSTPQMELRSFPKLLSSGLPFAATNVLSLIMTHAPTLILGATHGSAVAGLFAAGQRPVGVFWVLPNIISSALLPRLFRSGRSNLSDHFEVTTELIRYLAALGFLVGGILFISSEMLAVLIYGNEFQDSGLVIRGLAFFFAGQCINYPLGDYLTTTDRHGLRVISLGFGTATTVGLTLLLSTPFGLLGACFAALFSELVMMGLFIGFSRSSTPIRAPLMARLILAPMVGAVVGLGFSQMAIGRWWAQSWAEFSLASSLYLATQMILLIPQLPSAQRRRLLRVVVGRLT